jgi:hypothetical protein
MSFTIGPELQPEPVLTVSSPPENNIIFHTGTSEMLRVTDDGFYVRGQKVPIDDDEALAVYHAFRNFLTYHALSQVQLDT